MRAILFVLVATILSGCAGTPYQKMGVGGGYSDKADGPGRWKIKFISNVASTVGFAEKAALYRAAELAQSGGYPYFQVVDGEVHFTEFAIITSMSTINHSGDGQTANLVAVGALQKDQILTCEAPNPRICATFETAQTLSELRPVMKQAGRRRPVPD